MDNIDKKLEIDVLNDDEAGEAVLLLFNHFPQRRILCLYVSAQRLSLLYFKACVRHLRLELFELVERQPHVLTSVTRQSPANAPTDHFVEIRVVTAPRRRVITA